MRPLRWLVLALLALALPACVVVPAGGGGGGACEEGVVAAGRPYTAGQVQGRWQAYGSSYFSTNGGYDHAAIYWQGAPPPPGTWIEQGPFRRRRQMPVLVVGDEGAPAGPVLIINHGGITPRRRPCQ